MLDSLNSKALYTLLSHPSLPRAPWLPGQLLPPLLLQLASQSCYCQLVGFLHCIELRLVLGRQFLSELLERWIISTLVRTANVIGIHKIVYDYDGWYFCRSTKVKKFSLWRYCSIILICIQKSFSLTMVTGESRRP